MRIFCGGTEFGLLNDGMTEEEEQRSSVARLLKMPRLFSVDF